ncbi:MAG: hypothetical protein VKL42_17895 [Snowella sp.]|nr:hypothetical protein [Snowella sp.]
MEYNQLGESSEESIQTTKENISSGKIETESKSSKLPKTPNEVIRPVGK